LVYAILSITACFILNDTGSNLRNSGLEISEILNVSGRAIIADEFVAIGYDVLVNADHISPAVRLSASIQVMPAFFENVFIVIREAKEVNTVSHGGTFQV
jgi:hypothetical protein